MATTNLISQSLGDILTQSGNGTPDHTAPRGSIYTNQDTGVQYMNMTGAAVWTELVLSAFGELYLTTTNTLSPSTTGYTELTTNMSLRSSNGVSLSSGRLVVNSGFAGKYGVLLNATVQRNATTTTYTMGVSKNTATPAAGQIQRGSVDTTRTVHNINVYTTVDLAANDSISAVIQAGATGNVNVLYLNLFMWRKGA